jgi:hypothetical protein
MTALEFLREQCPRIETIASLELLEQAMEMEKQQIMDAYSHNGWNDNDNRIDAEQYYNNYIGTDCP